MAEMKKKVPLTSGGEAHVYITAFGLKRFRDVTRNCSAQAVHDYVL
jgi:hypothetical protein